MGKKIAEKKLKKQIKTKSTKKSKKITISIIIILIICSVLSIAFYVNKNKTPKEKTFVTVGSCDLTENEYVFYYTLCVNNYLSVYADDLSAIGLDGVTDYSKVYYDEDNKITWKQHFEELTNATIQTSLSLYNDAKKNNYTNIDEDFYNNFYNGLKSTAENKKLTFNNYLKETFCDTMTDKSLKSALKQYSLSLSYSESIKKNYKDEITEDNILDEYNKDPEQYKTVYYRIFSITYDDSIKTDNEKKSKVTKKTAKERANIIAKASNEKDFIKLSYENALKSNKDSYKDENFTKSLVTGKDSVIDDLREWMFDDNRKNGDIKIIENTDDKNYNVIYFINKERTETNTVNFRDIYLTNESYGSADNSKQAADKMYQLLKDDNMKESTFIEYANKYSEDTTTNGLYTSILKGSMLIELDDWLYNKNRKEGDSTVVTANLGNHILYFKSFGDPYWKELIKSNISDDKYDEYLDGLTKKYSVTFKTGEKYDINEETTKS